MSSTRGLVGVTISSGLLVALGKGLGLEFYAGLSSGIQLLVFLFHGLPFRSEKYYDISGSITHMALVFTSLIRTTRPRSVRQLFTALASTVWMTRLGSFLFLRIMRDGRDDRFSKIKPNALNFLLAWVLQALWVTVTETPTLLINEAEDKKPLTVTDYVAFSAWMLGFGIECLADMQKFVFRCDPANKGKFITTGVWSLARHPNYFGEILMWASLALSVSNSGAGDKMKWAWLSPAFTAALLLKLSGVPMLERASLKKWGDNPEFMWYLKNTSKVIPWFPAPAFPGKSN